MTIAFRIKSVTHTVETVSSTGESNTVDLSLTGQLLVHAEYVEEAAPQTVLAERRFVFPSTLTVADMQAQINGYGLSVRDARVATGELQEFVGAVVPLVDPPEPED